MVSLKGDLTPGRNFIPNSKTSAISSIPRKPKSALRPDEVKEQFLTAAGDELDAIVEATAEATNGIMDATEIVEGVMSGLEGEQRSD